MDRKYNFKKAKEIIESNKKELKSASLGMSGDWSWTAETVFENEEYIINLDTVKKIAGIDGSYWAIPTLQLEYKDGKYQDFSVYDEV